ncbi:MAG: ATP-binding protein [Candidatus Magnetominusculus sp. LBB02]|nr:ATP-binding protein [Candidatus Magnetominusculus sp. LBB02]
MYEELYQSEHLSEIDIKDYLQSLVRHLFHSFVVDMGKIDFRFEVESIAVGIDIAIPCGLIMNELFTNCLKYAFKGRDRGDITVRLRTLDEEMLELIVADNGVGIPEEVEIGKTKSLGLKVVSALTKQLKGQLELSRDNGTTFSLRFKRSLS